jgi:hypothetical protein
VAMTRWRIGLATRGFSSRVERLGPCAAHAQDLCTMNEALAAKWHQVRLSTAPAREHAGPLAHAAEIHDLATRVDDRAVHGARRDR